MPTTVIYDPTGVAPDNLFTAEVHTPVAEPDIFPNHGCFYAAGFVVHGTHAGTGVVSTLALFTIMFGHRCMPRSLLIPVKKSTVISC